MIGYFDKERLNDILKDFYNSVGIKISIFDTDFNMVTEYPFNHPKFCTMIRKSENGYSDCKKCDKSACIRAKMLKKPHIYTCHAGLTEAITPIEIGEKIIGYAILAHMLMEENIDSSINAAIRNASRYGIEERESTLALKEIVPRKKYQIESTVRVLDVLAKYLRLSDTIRWESENLSDLIDRFITENIDKKITSKDIMDKFGLSRTYLYHISMESYGMGIMQYVMERKMKKALDLLAQGLSVSSVSIECGFQDLSYFTKTFKAKYGILPSSIKSERKS